LNTQIAMNFSVFTFVDVEACRCRANKLSTCAGPAYAALEELRLCACSEL
jgi:hypothetical protein